MIKCFVFTSLVFISLFSPSLAYCQSAKHVSGVYRYPSEKRGRFDVWIVDGARIREDVYPEFVYGGNGERYTYVPKNEIWIDHAISAQEYPYTLAHELYERDLMAKRGLSYGDAHDSALMLENRMRRRDSLECAEHEVSLPLVSSYDCDSIKELAWLPDSIRLHNVYLEPLEGRDSLTIWIVDGARVRRDIYPDFGFSGNDEVYYFIPKREIWIDNAISCEETEFSIATEAEERSLMMKGASYDDAYEQALHDVLSARRAISEDVRRHEPVIVKEPLERDFGTGTEK